VIEKFKILSGSILEEESDYEIEEREEEITRFSRLAESASFALRKA
jgi:hypothetical protein